MNPKDIKTITDAQNYCEGVLNDFEAGICTKSEALTFLGEYTISLNDLFFKNAVIKIKANPLLLE